MAEVTINDTALSEYGAIMLAGSYASLLTPPQLKEWVSNDDPRKNGTDYIVPDDIVVQERTVNLLFGISANTQSDFLSKYNAFVSLLQSGMIALYVPDIGRYYHLRFESCTSFNNYSLKACRLAVRFIEPNPTKTTL